MLRLLLLFVCFAYLKTHAQSDGCSSATLLTVDATCSSPVNGTTTGATETIPGCTGTADDDVWYRFVATSTSHTITVAPSAGMDAVVQLFSGTCSALVSLVCRDNAFNGGVETITYSGLSVGTTYRIRVYHYGVGSGTGNFTICVTGAPSPPANDNCSGAIPLTVNAACTPVSGTLNGATQSLPGCSGTADDDVWYSFTATSSVQTVTVSPSSAIDLVMNIYAGNCSSLTSIACVDNTFTGGTESIQLVGLTVGAVYRIRVYDYYAGNSGDFTICVTGTPTAVPSNDEPCNAIPVPAVTSTCQYLEFTNVGATASLSAPAPFSCIGGSGAQIGGFNASTADVWFAITVPPSGNLNITHKPNMGPGSINDGVMALYSGTCGALTQIVCSDDNNYPGTANDFKPMINAGGLVPGSTVYLRYWGFGSNTGNFGFCVTTATNDECVNALYICDLNGYSASTSAAFTPDRPGNMHGNNETPAGVNLVDGTNSGGPFGYYPPSNIPGPYSSPNIDVNIENNSWIRFTAAATTATLTVSIYDCFVGNYPAGGIQMQIFSSNGCDAFVPVSNFEEHSSQFVITANGLTVGDDYILMVDGYAGDICNYTISANSGIQFPDIPDVTPICIGESVTLTAPAGADSYLWYHDGSTTQSVTVSPGTTQTYYCEVTGLCNYKQTLEVQVEVKPSPIIEFNVAANPVICSGESITLTATGADSYTWNTGQTTASITVSPTSQTTYTVNGEVDDCVASNSVTVQVNPAPVVSVIPNVPGPVCSGQSVTLTANGATTYLWSDGSTTSSITVSPSTTTSYTVTGTTGGCDATANYQVVVEPAPTVTITPGVTGAICSGESITLTAGGATTYSWSTGSTASGITVSPQTTTNYTVTGTSGNCSATAGYSVTVNPLPVISGTANVTPSDCGASTGTISGLVVNSPGITSYSWTNAAAVEVGNTLNVNGLPAGSYTLTVTDANNCEAQFGPVTISNPGAPDVPSIAVSDNMLCPGASVSFSTTAQPGATFEWTGPGGFTTSDAQFTIDDFTENDTGNYCLTVTIAGCTSPPACEMVGIHALPDIQVTTSGTGLNICEGGTANLSATGGVNYSWTGPGSYTGSGSSVQVQPFHSENSGYYVVTGTDANGCSNEDSVLVSMVDNPDISISADAATGVYCNNSSAVLTASGADQYSWEGPGNTSFSGNSITISGLNASNTGWYIVTGTDANNCTSTDSIEIAISIPGADIHAGNDGIVCPGESVPFYASDAPSYEWTGPQGYITDEQDFILVNAQPENSGWYYITITDSSGCSATDSTYLSVEPKADCLVIPDLVTPDGDLLNDTWTIPGLENFPGVSVEIYNRWGNLIFKTDSYQNDWNGEVNHGATIGSGGKVPTGTYFYILVLNDPENTPPYKGYIEVQY